MSEKLLNTERTFLTDEETAHLGTLTVHHPPGTFGVTPASRVTLEAIGRHQTLLEGRGADWGCGCGILALAASRCSNVKSVIGLDIERANVEIARQNALVNCCENVMFVESNSFSPRDARDIEVLASFGGKFDFLIVNPPSSDGDDGFGFRRIVLRDARDYLRMGALCLVSISLQYGRRRIERLQADVPGYTFEGLLATTDWVPFDLRRADLLDCVRLYAAEEERGGLPYEFSRPDTNDEHPMNARSALEHFERSGQSPLSKWQTYLFRRDGPL